MSAKGRCQTNHPEIPAHILETLRTVYDEVMWLSRRPHVTVGMARAWYALIRAEPLKRQL